MGNMAMTLDGRVMLPAGRWRGLTSRTDRRRMDEYRLEADALIIGKNSVIRDDPDVTSRLEGAPKQRPIPVMICRHGLPPENRKIFTGEVAPLLFVHTRLADALGALNERCEVELLDDDRLGPAAVLERLRERGLRRVLLEGGPVLNHAFFSEDLVDVLYLTIVPYLIGQRGLPSIVDGERPFSDFQEQRWELRRAETIGNEAFLQYRRIRITGSMDKRTGT